MFLAIDSAFVWLRLLVEQFRGICYYWRYFSAIDTPGEEAASRRREWDSRSGWAGGEYSGGRDRQDGAQ